MKKLLPILTLFLLIPTIGFCGNSGEALFKYSILIIVLAPYYGFAILAYFIHKRNKRRSLFVSILTYLLCIGGITLANYQSYRFGIPGVDFAEDDGMFYLMILPFVIIIILAAVKDFNYKYESNE